MARAAIRKGIGMDSGSRLNPIQAMNPRPHSDDSEMPRSGSAIPYRRRKYTIKSSASRLSVQNKMPTI